MILTSTFITSQVEISYTLTALLTQFQTDKQLSLFKTHTHTHLAHHKPDGPPDLYSTRNDRIPPAKQLTLPSHHQFKHSDQYR
jgi:hypothetical protein